MARPFAGLNHRTAGAWLLQETHPPLREQPTRPEAAAFLQHWISMAMESQLRPMQEFASLLEGHRGVPAYLELPIDNGLVKAMNANPKAISMRAPGYRSPAVFSTLLLRCLGGLQMPTFRHQFA
ncbi:MAG: transposase [bacterium]|nr:transposase [bacterium]